MRIGVNTLFMLPGKVGGTETYVRGLLYGLSKVDKVNEYILFTNNSNHNSIEISSDRFSKILCMVSETSRLARVVYEQLFLPGIAAKHAVDILHSPGYVSPIAGKFAKVVTIHDMQYMYYPAYFNKAKLAYWKYLLPKSAKKSDVILTVSENSKADIIDFLKIPSNKVFVTYEAAKLVSNSTEDDVIPDITKKFGIYDDYILSVASLLPHKNLNKLIDSFVLLEDKIAHQLVFVGLKRSALNEIKKTAENKLKNPNRIAILGYIPDQDLSAVYKRASLFVLPSLFEGFGIPLLEAMSFGCPVAASNKTSIPEVVGDSAILFDPNSSEQIAEKISDILFDNTLRERLIDKGLQRSKMFSWEKMAEDTIQAYSAAYKMRQKI